MISGNAASAQSRKRIEGAGLKGPYVDLTTPQGNMIAYARLAGDIDMKSTTYGWYDGVVLGTAPGAAVKSICGFKGMSAYKLIPMADGSAGYRRILREVGFYYDLATGKIVEELDNPYTGARVKVVPIANDPFNAVIRDTLPPLPTYGGLNTATREPRPFLLDWQLQAPDRVLMRRTVNLYYKNALDPAIWARESSGPMVQVSEVFNYVINLHDLQNEELTHTDYSGTWTRWTPWLPWMLMGPAPGGCLYQCFMGTPATLDDIPQDILEYTQKHFPKYLTAPDDWVEPSLSSIEMYAKTQTPAQPREA
jgi:hypothetical protein